MLVYQLKKIPFHLANMILLATMILALIFHIFVITGVIPQNMVWGGRMESKEELLEFEIISIANLLLMMLIIFLRWKSSNIKIKKVTRVFIWIFAALFLLNTVGNIFSKTSLETIIFTPITAISCLLCVRIAVEEL